MRNKPPLDLSWQGVLAELSPDEVNALRERLRSAFTAGVRRSRKHKPSRTELESEPFAALIAKHPALAKKARTDGERIVKGLARDIEADISGAYERALSHNLRQRERDLDEVQSLRSAQGRKAARVRHAKDSQNRKYARDWYAAHKNLSKNDAAQRIKDEGVVCAAFRTIRGYLTGQ